MSQINDTSIVKKQYATANNLNTRISIHDKYSTNKMGFGNWLNDPPKMVHRSTKLYPLPANQRALLL